MKYKVLGKNLDVSDALEAKIKKKFGKVEKYFNPDTEMHVTMGIEKSRHLMEATVHSGGMAIRAEVTSGDMYSAIDKAIDIIESQIRKNKTRLEKRLRADAFKGGGGPAEDVAEEEMEFKVLRSKKFAIKPMPVEEAILQMNLLGHEFFMFSNSDTKEVNVVYKRKDGNYGLIEPEF